MGAVQRLAVRTRRAGALLPTGRAVGAARPRPSPDVVAPQRWELDVHTVATTTEPFGFADVFMEALPRALTTSRATPVFSSSPQVASRTPASCCSRQATVRPPRVTSTASSAASTWTTHASSSASSSRSSPGPSTVPRPTTSARGAASTSAETLEHGNGERLEPSDGRRPRSDDVADLRADHDVGRTIRERLAEKGLATALRVHVRGVEVRDAPVVRRP